MNYYKTIPGDYAKELKQTKRQSDRILMIFKLQDKPLTPFDVLEIYSKHFAPTPITSIRRAMTDLALSGQLEKTQDFKKGAYGKVNHKWKINN